MTLEQKRITFIKALVNQTDAGELRWEETNYEGIFQVSFPEYSVQVYYTKRPHPSFPGEAEVPAISVYNEKGLVIDRVDQFSFVQRARQNLVGQRLRRLYDSARRMALGVEEAYDSLLAELKADVPPEEEMDAEAEMDEDTIPF